VPHQAEFANSNTRDQGRNAKNGPGGRSIPLIIGRLDRPPTIAALEAHIKELEALGVPAVRKIERRSSTGVGRQPC